MLEKHKIINELSASTKTLINEFAGIDEELFNIKPSENVWSAGNIAEHLIILESYINKIFTGKTKNSDRDPLKNVELIKQYLMDFDKKLNAPEPIAPQKTTIGKEYILKEFWENRNTLNKIISINDLTLVCLEFNHRLFGELTGAEWVYFIIFHTERHLYQLNKLVKRLKAE
jgi:uncharacterized damage-inducible protein DinB